MTKKRNIILSIILFFIIVLIFLFFNSRNKILISTENKNIYINNIYKNPIIEYPNKDIVFKDSPAYSMFYNNNEQLFNITILDSDIQKARNEAEKEFIKTLDVTKDEACRLNVNLGIPYNVNAQKSGINYGLSFCPNGVQF